MKYDRPHWIKTAWATAFIGVLALVGCAGQQQKAPTEVAEVKPQQSLTKSYLPVRQYDKDGNLIPFLAAINPYEQQKGRIDKEVVMDFIEARKAFKRKDYKECTARLEHIIEKDKSLAGPWVMLGNIALAQDDSEAAMAYFKKAISTNKLNVNAYLPLAKLQREKGEFILAQNTYAAALAVWKDFPEAHLNLGILYDLYLNDPLQAQQHLEAYQFLTGYKDEKVAEWLEEIRSRTGIAPNLYIGPSNTSQIQKTTDDKG